MRCGIQSSGPGWQTADGDTGKSKDRLYHQKQWRFKWRNWSQAEGRLAPGVCKSKLGLITDSRQSHLPSVEVLRSLFGLHV